MKITGVETFVVGNPPPHFGGAYFIFLKLSTDAGITGLGEVYSVPFHPHVVARMIEDVCERKVIGTDPHRIEVLWRRVYSSGYTQRPDVSLVGVLSGIEMACWDIIGKACGKPIYELLGGRVHDRLRSYSYLYPKPGDATDVYMDADLAAERAAEYAALGFTALKFDPAGPFSAFDPRQPSLESLDRSEDFARKLRAAVGMGSSRSLARCAWRGGWNPTIRCGSRSRRRPRCRRRWRWLRARPRSRSRPASG
jgi:galactonate dehydratase